MKTSNQSKSNKKEKILLLVILILGWFALSTQFYVTITHRQVSLLQTIIKFLSYFTILTNLLVAICCTMLFIGKRILLYNFFSKPSTLTPIAVYILIVGIIFNLLLRSIVSIHGIQNIDSEIFHVVVPILFFVYWLYFVPRQNFVWHKTLIWLIYPVAYVVYTLIHGLITNYYPYPFIDVHTLGFTKAVINGALVMLAFFLLSIVLINVKKIKSKEIIEG